MDGGAEAAGASGRCGGSAGAGWRASARNAGRGRPADDHAAPLLHDHRTGAARRVGPRLVRGSDPRVPRRDRGAQRGAPGVHHGDRGAARSRRPARSTREIAAGRLRGPLHGIPISLKDLIDQRGVPTTAASRVREGHVAAEDAPVTARLREAGAVLVGKTNLHEFAFGTTSDDTAFGAVRNPHDQSRSPGGSSGGSAVAIRHRHVGGLDRHRHRRVHPHPVGGVRHGRPQADVGRGPVRRRRAAQPDRSITSARWRDPWPTRGCSTSCCAATRRRRAGPCPRGARVKGLRLGIPAAVLPRRPRRRGAAALRGVARVAAAGGRRDRRRRHPARVRRRRPSTCTRRCRRRPRITPGRSSPSPSATRRTCACASRWGGTCWRRTTSGRRHARAALREEVDAALAGCDALALPTLPIPAPPIGAATVDVAGTPQDRARDDAAPDAALQPHRPPGYLDPGRADRVRPALRASARRTSRRHRGPARRGVGLRAPRRGVNQRYFRMPLKAS